MSFSIPSKVKAQGTFISIPDTTTPNPTKPENIEDQTQTKTVVPQTSYIPPKINQVSSLQEALSGVAQPTQQAPTIEEYQTIPTPQQPFVNHMNTGLGTTQFVIEESHHQLYKPKPMTIHAEKELSLPTVAPREELNLLTVLGISTIKNKYQLENTINQLHTLIKVAEVRKITLDAEEMESSGVYPSTR